MIKISKIMNNATVTSEKEFKNLKEFKDEMFVNYEQETLKKLKKTGELDGICLAKFKDNHRIGKNCEEVYGFFIDIDNKKNKKKDSEVSSNPLNYEQLVKVIDENEYNCLLIPSLSYKNSFQKFHIFYFFENPLKAKDINDNKKVFSLIINEIFKNSNDERLKINTIQTEDIIDLSVTDITTRQCFLTSYEQKKDEIIYIKENGKNININILKENSNIIKSSNETLNIKNELNFNKQNDIDLIKKAKKIIAFDNNFNGSRTYHTLISGIKMFHDGANQEKIEKAALKWYSFLEANNNTEDFSKKKMLKTIFDENNSSLSLYKRNLDTEKREVLRVANDIIQTRYKLIGGNFYNTQGRVEINKDKLAQDLLYITNNKETLFGTGINKKRITKTFVLDLVIEHLEEIAGAVYLPNFPETYINNEGLKYINLFKPNIIKGEKGDFKFIQDVVSYICSNDKDLEKVLYSYFYYVYKCIPCGIMPMLVTEGGQGKGILFEQLVSLLLGETPELSQEDKKFSKVNSDTLTSKFNDFLEKPYVLLNEISIPDSKQRRQTSQDIKGWLEKNNRAGICITGKGKKTKTIPIISNLALTTNDVNCIIIDEDDRRVLVINKKIQYIKAENGSNQIAKIDETVIALKDKKNFDVNAQLEKEISAFIYFLENELNIMTIPELENYVYKTNTSRASLKNLQQDDFTGLIASLTSNQYLPLTTILLNKLNSDNNDEFLVIIYNLCHYTAKKYIPNKFLRYIKNYLSNYSYDSEKSFNSTMKYSCKLEQTTKKINKKIERVRIINKNDNFSEFINNNIELFEDFKEYIIYFNNAINGNPILEITDKYKEEAAKNEMKKSLNNAKKEEKNEELENNKQQIMININ